MNKKIGMTAIANEFHYFGKERPVFFPKLLRRHGLTILLQTPCRPKQSIGLFHLIDRHAYLFLINIITYGDGRSVHILFILRYFAY